MKIFELIDRLQLINKLVEERRTGTPEELAERLGIKRRTLYELLDELKSHNVPISYSRVSKTFFYTHAVDFQLNCKIRLLDEKEMAEKNGGFSSFRTPCSFSARSKPTFAL